MTSPVARLLRLFAPDGRRIGGAVLLQFGTMAAGIALMATSAWLIATAALHPSIAALAVAVVGVRALGIARGLLRYFERLAAHDLTLRLFTRVRTWLYAALQPLAPARLIERSSGDLLARVVSDVDALEQVYVRLLGPSAAALLVAALCAALLAPRGAALATAAVVGLLGAGAGASWLAWRLGRAAGAEVVRARSEVEGTVVDGIQGLPDLLAHGAAARHQETVAAAAERLACAQLRAAGAAAMGGALVGVVADLTALAVLVMAIASAARGALDGVQLAVVTLLTLAAFEAVTPLPAAWQSLGAAREAAARMFELVDSPPALAPGGAVVSAPEGTRLEMANVSFTHAGAVRPAVQDVTLAVSPGRLVALVGPSGSGKSTLAHLALRYWDPSAGDVRIDGVDVRRLDADAVRARIAFVPQRAHLFSGTLADNVRLARPDATPAELTSALLAVGLGELTSTLPAGADTWIGEQGVHMSGGERQRIALARALLKPAHLLVLDEPTANVDPVSERSIVAALRDLARTRGVLLVTHRLDVLREADEIVVLEDGRVTARGQFDTLARTGGWFARMLRLEAERLDVGASWASEADHSS
ncbi:MAG TPA: thiol reductant ABC exporter subunit CydC [Gemmatimonadales bacterium]|nr:thiol reductant ABC exporter subunit CydC [Gemmatimonadales bacterium]